MNMNMKKTIAKFVILAALFLSAATISAEEKDGQKVYRGTVSIGYTAPLNFNVRTTHGVVYDRSNIFIGGEAQYRFGFEDGSIVKAGAAFRWSYVSRKLVDAYLGCGGGLHVSKNGSTGLNGELVNNFGMGLYLSPELGVGIGLGNGDYIDIGEPIAGGQVQVLEEGDTCLLFPGVQMEVFATPGHDESCLTYRADGCVFSGDSYIPGQKVIATFPHSSKAAAESSRRRILALADGCGLYPGHGASYPVFSRAQGESCVYCP